MSEFAQSIIKGLEEVVSYQKGEIKLTKHRYAFKPIPEFSPTEIRDIRIRARMSQSVFALVLGVSTKTVEAWESGINKPKGSSRRLLELIEEDPKFIERYYTVK